MGAQSNLRDPFLYCYCWGIDARGILSLSTPRRFVLNGTLVQRESLILPVIHFCLAEVFLLNSLQEMPL